MYALTQVNSIWWKKKVQQADFEGDERPYFWWLSESGAPVHLVKNEKYSLQRKIHVKYFKKLRYFCSELRRDAI